MLVVLRRSYLPMAIRARSQLLALTKAYGTTLFRGTVELRYPHRMAEILELQCTDLPRLILCSLVSPPLADCRIIHA